MRQPDDTRLVQRITAALRSGNGKAIALGGLPVVTVSYRMRVACAWCGVELPPMPVSHQTELVSHGICPVCYASQMVALLGGEG